MLTWRAIGRNGHYAELSLPRRVATDAVLFTASYGGSRVNVEKVLIQNYQNNGAVTIRFVDGRTYQIPAYTNMYIDCAGVDVMAITNYGSQTSAAVFFDAEGSLSYKNDSISFSAVTVSINDLLYHFDSSLTTNAGAETGGVITSAAGVAIDSSSLKFGGASANFGASGDYWWYTNGSFFPLNSTEDWCLDFWLNPMAMSGGADPIHVAAIDTGSEHIGIRTFDNSGSRKLGISRNSVLIVNDSVTSVNPGTWSHVALTCASGTLRLFVDGALRCSTDIGLSTTGNYLRMGDAGAIASNNGIDFLDELRYTKGSAVWTDDFTVATSPYI